MRPPFWAPGLYFTHECPDLFRMGDWWYLVYSTFSERHVTHYRMSRSLHGPWQAPENDAFDGRAYYAAKSASDGQRRFLFGWAATREGEKDTGPWQWGGNLVVHELHQEADGTLSVAVPPSVDQAFARPNAISLQPGLGEYEPGEGGVRVAAPEGFGCALAGALPKRCKIEATVALEPGTRGAGVMLRCSEDLESAYYVRLEPGRQRLVFNSWPRPGDVPFAVELERPLSMTPGQPVTLQLFVEKSLCVVYAAGTDRHDRPPLQPTRGPVGPLRQRRRRRLSQPLSVRAGVTPRQTGEESGYLLTQSAPPRPVVGRGGGAPKAGHRRLRLALVDGGPGPGRGVRASPPSSSSPQAGKILDEREWLFPSHAAAPPGAFRAPAIL